MYLVDTPTRTPELGRVKAPTEPKWSTLPLAGSPTSTAPISWSSTALMMAEEKVVSPMRPTTSAPSSISCRSTASRGQITPSDPPPLFRRSTRIRL